MNFIIYHSVWYIALVENEGADEVSNALDCLKQSFKILFLFPVWIYNIHLFYIGAIRIYKIWL